MSLAIATATVLVERPTESRLIHAVDRWMTLRQQAAEIAVGRHLNSRPDEDLRRLGLTDAEIAHLRQSGTFRRLGA